MTLRTADVIPPVLTPTKVVMGFLAGVTAQTSFGGRFRITFLEGNYFGNVSRAFDVCLARSVTGLAADHFSFPGFDGVKFAVLSSFEDF